MSHWLGRAAPGEPQGYHDIDTEIDSSTLERLPHGLMEHHAFQPHLWRAGDRVVVTTTDQRQYKGHALEVSNNTGNVLIQLETIPREPLRVVHAA
jgi:hypothetical protein